MKAMGGGTQSLFQVLGLSRADPSLPRTLNPLRPATLLQLLTHGARTGSVRVAKLPSEHRP